MAPNILPIIDRRTEFEGKPGTHALIVGVSDYPHLLDGTGAPAPNAYGMYQLSSAALTAYKVFRWLEEWKDKLKTPLVTCRLLLSPSSTERDIEKCLGNLPDSYSSIREHFDLAAYGWRDDAESHEENITFFYFAGHGIQQMNTTNDKYPVLLMQDFGGDKYKSFDEAVHSQNLVDGMKDVSARKQMYFFDCCRTVHKDFKNLESKVPDVWDVNPLGTDSRILPVFSAALPGGIAYSIKGEQTHFSKALLECLRGGAGKPRRFEELDDRKHWYISPDTLYEGLNRYTKEINENRNKNEQQEFEMLGARSKLDDMIICFLETAPQVNVEFKVNPVDAHHYTKLSVLTSGRIPELLDQRGNIKIPPVRLDPHPFKCMLPAGRYDFKAIVDPSQRSFQDHLYEDEDIWPPHHIRLLDVMK